jgi:predicted MFS family arabinose efflux permease
MELPFFVAGGLALLNTLALWLFLPESLTEENRKLHPAAGASIWKTLQEAKSTPLGTLMMCSLLSTMAFSLMTALFTLFTQQRLNWHAQENGLLFAYIGILGVLIQGGMLRRLVPRTGEKPLIIIGSIVLCISSILLPISSNLALIILASSGLSIGNSLTTPMLSGLASKSADAQSQGAVMGLMQSIASLGRMLGPALGGVLLNYDWLNPNHPYGITPFWFAAILMLFAIVAAYRLAPTKHTLHLEQTP